MEEKYETLKIQQESPNSRVFNLILNRPHVSNALSHVFFNEFPKALNALDQNPNVAVIILSGSGNHFCGGIDLNTLTVISNDNSEGDHGRTGERLRRHIKFLQHAITAIELCRKPVIASIHGACLGLGINIITACDIRYCSNDAFFSVKEVDLAITADLGTLQRLPGIVGSGNAMELSLTGRRFSSHEAKGLGLVSRVFESREEMKDGVLAIAEDISGKPPLAVVGTKAVLIRSRDMNLEQGFLKEILGELEGGPTKCLKHIIQKLLKKKMENYLFVEYLILGLCRHDVYFCCHDHVAKGRFRIVFLKTCSCKTLIVIMLLYCCKQAC